MRGTSRSDSSDTTQSSLRRSAGGADQYPRPRRHIPWSPGPFGGASPISWARLLRRNHFAVSPLLLHRFVVNAVGSLSNCGLGAIQSLVYGRKIARTKIEQDPIFVIGHWRSGTTLLHELLTFDERHGFPSNHACMTPSHFLISGWAAPIISPLFFPSRRSMDNVSIGATTPQEDEFALANLGVPSPYIAITFPNHPVPFQEYETLDDLSESDREAWRHALRTFLQALSVRDGRRLVLKSPLHTMRIPMLLEMFPDARFVHIVREPTSVFASTVHLWRTLYATLGLQRPTYQGLEEEVLERFERMYRRLRQTRHLVPSGRICNVRYEDLVSDPVGQMRHVYSRLELGDFDSVEPRMEAFAARGRSYRTNRYQISDATREVVWRRWGPLMAEYGYGAGFGGRDSTEERLAVPA